MKYPQLVSTRAVNAISDWLVSRLEQLGVEAPQIYTRLLLSLLQSSVQINDPIEFSNLESFFAHRKGGNKRYLSCDTETLKKLNAVQCLRDIVSSEQEIATIENLVDELCVKLKDVEQQNADSEDEDKLLVATLSLATTSSVANQRYSVHLQHHHNHQNHQNPNHPQPHHPHTHSHSNKPPNNVPHKLEPLADSSHTTSAADIETDPKKRYFRAFPALSKEMEDSFRAWRLNAKSLTWPVERNKQSISTSSSSSTISSSFGINRSAGAVGVNETVISNASEIYADDKKALNMSHEQKCNSSSDAAEGLDLAGNNHSTSMGTAGVKRKSKRRRNQALSKGKSANAPRKSGHFDNIEGHGCDDKLRKNHRHSSPSYWDTDFEGCWEMGPDLIKEFIVRQNKDSRNRSTSESAAYNIRSAAAAATAASSQANNKEINAEKSEQKIAEHGGEEKHSTADKVLSPSLQPLVPIVDISFCCDDDYDDTLASVSELTNDVYSLNASSTAPRRLYERDIKGSNELLPTDESEDTMSNEQSDFEQFKAKFNSSVEALWKDAENEDTSVVNAPDASLNVFGMNNSQLSSSLPAVANLKENLKNFWAKYYNHHFDVAKMQTQEAAIKNNNDNGPTAKAEENGLKSGYGDAFDTSDYFSMPPLEVFDCPGRVRRQTNDGLGTPIALFLQNSIWSEPLNTDAGDTDESFYLKVRNSAKRLNQLDVVSGIDKANDDLNSAGKSEESGFGFPPYSASKWSEGINAGPNVHQQHIVQTNQQQMLQSASYGGSGASSVKSNNCNLLTLSTDCTDSSASTSLSATSSASNFNHQPGAFGGAAVAGAYNWQTPINAQNLQVDLQSWSASNPLSLTELYGGGSSSAGSSSRNMKEADMGASASPFASVSTCMPSITLLNHSPTSSGFVEYARIKSVVQIFKQDPMKAPGPNYAAQLRSKERYADDENLLTSERTHFHPIKSYVDGYTFDICSALDVIQYKRSDSGYLYLEEEKYLEYTRSDNCMAEDDAGISATPLYASSNCEAATARLQRQGGGGRNKYENDFVIKFRLQNTEIACQTEDDLEMMAINNQNVEPQQQQHPLSVIFSNAAKGVKMPATSQACNDAIQALNKAVAAAAKAAAAANMPTDNHWLPTAEFGSGINDVYQRHRESLIWNVAQQASPAEADTSKGSDEVDFCPESEASLEQQWSMSEIRKKCQLAGHFNNYNNGNNNNNNGGQNIDGMQSLWGMCAACNSELKSVPANRLLRDELKLEADEIMSDLKYMQDLYIGRSDDDSDTASEGEWIIDEGDHEDEDDGANQTDMEMMQPFEGQQNEAATIYGRPEEGESRNQDSQTYNVIEKVNRLIAVFLRPDNVFITSDRKDEVDNGNVTMANENDKQFYGSLWQGNSNERNIWQVSATECAEGGGNVSTLKPLEVFRQLNMESMESGANEDGFLSQLNWEHGNLAEIWQKTTPPQQREASEIQQSNLEKENAAPGNREKSCSNRIEDKNMRNLKESWLNAWCSFPDRAENEMNEPDHSTNAIYKRVQQLLNNSTVSSSSTTTAAKLKLSNRKRRHSASQNYFHHLSAANALTNNNNADIADLNHFDLKSNAAAAAAAAGADNDNSYVMDMQNLLNMNSCDEENCHNEPNNNNSDQPSNQTIITCKYHWTTIDAAEVMQQENEDADMLGCTTLSCLIDKNASILKHVTMVTRPLTR